MTTRSLTSASNPASISLIPARWSLTAKMPIQRAAGVPSGSSDAQGIEMAPLAESEAEHTETEPTEVLAFGMCGRTLHREGKVPRMANRTRQRPTEHTSTA